MSAEQNGPERQDGTAETTYVTGYGTEPLPCRRKRPDDEATTAAAGPPSASGSTDDWVKGTGPAAEQDRETPDSRGLTTDTSPGD